MYGDADFGLAVSTKSQHQAAAETFVKWMTTTKAGQQVVANQLNDIPVAERRDARLHEDRARRSRRPSRSRSRT